MTHLKVRTVRIADKKNGHDSVNKQLHRPARNTSDTAGYFSLVFGQGFSSRLIPLHMEKIRPSDVAVYLSVNGIVFSSAMSTDYSAFAP